MGRGDGGEVVRCTYVLGCDAGLEVKSRYITCDIDRAYRIAPP